MMRISSSTVALTLIVFCLINLLGSLEIKAQVITPFQVRYTTNTEGAINIYGNEILTCTSSESRCAQAQAGAALNNNIFSMIYVDIDNDPSTFNSSSAYVNLIEGTEVLFAGLYWGAEYRPTTSPDPRASILFKSPIDTTYRQLTGTVLGQRSGDYQSFIDVTSLVKSAGGGNYTAANISANTGGDKHGGWALVIAFSAPGEPPRNLTIYDGVAFVGTSSTVTIPVSGFLTPPQGPVNTRLGVVAYEGDRANNGDSIQLNSTPVGNSLNPTNNFFNSTITALDNKRYERVPDHDNTLGFDADVVDASGILPNNATSAVITLSSQSEVYFPGVVTFSTELFASKLESIKSGQTITRSLGNNLPGDTLEYTIAIKNTGLDNSKETVLYDSIPANSTYVPGSLAILSGANAGNKTDALNDDQAEFDSVNNRVVFRLGTGADSTKGGVIAVNEETAIKFRVQINANAPDQASVDNQASISSISQTLNKTITSVSNHVHHFVATPPSPNISMEKALQNLTRTNNLYLPGDIVEYTVSVTHKGGDFTKETVLQDNIPNYTTYVPGSLKVLSGFYRGPKTDIAGDDTAEFDTANNRIVFRIGLNANASNGGMLQPPNRISIRFQVRVNDNTLDKQTVPNFSNLNYLARTTNQPGNIQSNTVNFIVKNSPSRINVAKTFANLTRTTNAHYPGDIIEYTTTINNAGQDNVTESVFSDFIPANTTYFPDSLQILYGSNPGPKTDKPGDDQAEFDPVKNRVLFRIGSGSDLINGGIIAPQEQIVIAYKVKINDGVQNNSIIDNRAQISAVNSVTGDTISQNSNQILFNIYNPLPPILCTDIFIDISNSVTTLEPGEVTESIFSVKNLGPTEATSINLDIDIPDGLIFKSVSTTQGTCSGIKQINCSLGNLTADKVITITVKSVVQPDAQPGSLNFTARVNATECDSCMANNSITRQITIRETQLLHCPKDPK